MTQQELEKYLWGAATILRGTIDAGDYKQYIFPLLFYKRICDVYDEEFERALEESDGDMEYAAFDENHHFKVPEDAHWKTVRQTTTNVGQTLQSAMHQIEQSNPEMLAGIFGDASWTNKDRLSDETLTNLIEHYSTEVLNSSNIPDDQLGNAYEYLIKEFADDSGHTAAEFYTNRTVVKLMTKIMDPKPGESVYDPTCGSGGLLLNCALQLKEEGKEYRNLKLYGQEINLITSAIARMNMFLHGIQDFEVVRGDTLARPAFIENDELKKFNIILANPPYSIKNWDRESFVNDPYGRNIWGTPPQGCADYAFQQHIHKSLNSQNGRYAILWPHGILFREMESELRIKMLEEDSVEAVIGLGPSLFYNSPMEAMILIGNNNKPKERRGKILFVNAKEDVNIDKGQAWMTDKQINKVYELYKTFDEQQSYSSVVDVDEVLSKGGNMNISFYIESLKTNNRESFSDTLNSWEDASTHLENSMNQLFKN
ncbi:MAG: class I SAM-dependent DNA methyltransferase [Bacteroidetes bacterium]|nr:class I SAM-dependent DNA methyltransferase [Bacteroidota bacterium]